MALALVIFLLALNIGQSGAKISFVSRNYSTTIECVKTIIKRHFEFLSVVTFVDFHSKDMDILKSIHSMQSMSVINRKPFKKILLPNRSYLIFTKRVEDFVSKFRYLLAEKSWMPYAPFIIVVQFLEALKLIEIFQILLKFHVKDVIVVDGNTTSTYTYDPYENNGCGKRFDKIHNLGKCLSDSKSDQYPRKVKNYLQNCTVNMASTHYPPYSVDPNVCSVNSTGVDEYLFSLFGEHWNFKVNLSYFDNKADEVSVVDEDMVASGVLAMIQENRFDVVSGAMVLILNRATAFTFLYGHTSYDDEFRVIVHKAPILPPWKLIFLEFSPLVWILILFTFGVVATLIIVISKTDDKSLVILNLWDILLQHTCRIRRTPKIEIILILWYVSACLLSYHYLSSLFGLSAKPIYTSQIGSIADLTKFHFKPCIGEVMDKFNLLVSELDALTIDDNIDLAQCKTMSKSLETVSKSPDMYTVIPFSQYYSDRYRYYDEYGVNKLYSFREPLSKIIYAIFLSKGFPMYDEFHLATLWIRSAGLVNKVWGDYEYQQKKQFMEKQKTTLTLQRFHLPLCIIIFGWIVSTLCFIS